MTLPTYPLLTAKYAYLVTGQAGANSNIYKNVKQMFNPLPFYMTQLSHNLYSWR